MERSAWLQTIRLKGLAPVPVLAEALDVDRDDAERGLAELAADGLVETLSLGVRLTAAGRERLESALSAERSALDRVALAAVVERFDAINGELKQLVTDWQLREIDGVQQMNAHDDPDYDRGIVARLLALHERFVPVARDAARCVPRLAGYARRFAKAHERVAAGEHRFIAAPLVDSYHTVWFEFHEELLQACGRKRSEEAAAGRAD